MSEETFIRKYWKQIDLHSHTLRGVDCAGRSDSANYKHKLFRDNIVQFKTQLQAVTNHNTLHLEDHIKHAIICEMIGVSYIPGVEIDVKLKDKNKPFQCVFLLGPNNDICEFSKRLNGKTNEKRASGKVYYDEEELAEIFSDMHFIYVVHAVKTKGLAASQDSIESDRENINWVCKAIKNALAEPILFENTKPKYVHSFMNRFLEFTDREDIIRITSQQVTTSDYKFDGDVDRYNKWLNREKYAICAEPTFEGLELSIRHYQSRFQLVEEIVEPPTFIERINFIKQKNKKLDINGSIDCSPYFNVIIGNSGTGKTLLLNEIYRSVSKNNQNLNAVINKDSKIKDVSESVYCEYIGKKTKILEPTFYKGIIPVAVEIDKIYKKMLDASDPVEIAKLFSVSLPVSVNLILQKYKTEMIKYENQIIKYHSLLDQGEEAFNSIKSNVAFVESNKGGNKSITLSREVFDETQLNSLKKSQNQLKQLIEEKTPIENWIKMAGKILPESADSVELLQHQFNEILRLLELKKQGVDLKIKKETINKRFIEIYNTSADSVNKLIGNKQVAVGKAKSTIKEQINNIRDYVKEIIRIQLSSSSIDLSYPFEEIERKSLESQENMYARVSVKYSDKDKILDAYQLDSQRVINVDRNITKIKNTLTKRNYKLEKDEDVKKIIDELIVEEIKLSSLLNTEIPFVTELFDNQSWKSVQNINPGNLAKDYMIYYFKTVLETQRPNIVFIDQPENDVDKSFIGNVLRTFITENKIGIQFFITSHEPILGVNADSNLIIEAFRYDDGPISYRARSFESTPLDGGEKGKDVASRILDGGKDNVIQRNQIYGGSLDD